LAKKPTFVSVHLGDNDAFRAALSGSAGDLTSLASFTASYQQVVGALASLKHLEGAILIGIVNPIAVMPILQPGAFFFLARDASGDFLGKPVNDNCSPLVPNPLAANLISFAILIDGNFPAIDCDPAAYPIGDPRRGAYLLDPAEQVAIATRVAQFNAAIAQAAAANGWAYFDPNPMIGAALATRTPLGRADQIRKCQDLASATNLAELQAAVLNTCPVSGPTAAPNLFGFLISFDGVHPSGAGQALLAERIAEVIDLRYDTGISPL
jgi:lysophospholipase L1-like esterase